MKIMHVKNCVLESVWKSGLSVSTNYGKAFISIRESDSFIVTVNSEEQSENMKNFLIQ